VITESVTMVHVACLLLIIVLNLTLFFMQLRVDKLNLIDLCGTFSSEFTTVMNPLSILLFVPAPHLYERVVMHMLTLVQIILF
jgi:hypothetical protein